MNRIGMREPKHKYKKSILIDSLKDKIWVGGDENNEIQEHTDGNDAGIVETDTPAS